LIYPATTWKSIGQHSNSGPNDGFVLKRAKFKKYNAPGFLKFALPQEIQAMLSLLPKLYLESHLVPQDKTYLVDSCMLEIKASSHQDIAGSDIHANSFQRANTTFTKFVIDYLSIALLFDNWYPFAGNCEYRSECE
jgi:hypothetical protein